MFHNLAIQNYLIFREISVSFFCIAGRIPDILPCHSSLLGRTRPPPPLRAAPLRGERMLLFSGFVGKIVRFLSWILQKESVSVRAEECITSGNVFVGASQHLMQSFAGYARSIAEFARCRLTSEKPANLCRQKIDSRTVFIHIHMRQQRIKSLRSCHQCFLPDRIQSHFGSMM